MAIALENIKMFFRLIKLCGFSFIKSPSQFVFVGYFLNSFSELN